MIYIRPIKAIAFIVAVSFIVVSAAPAASQHAQVASWKKHHPECNTHRCAHRADLIWNRHQAAKRARQLAREAREVPVVSAHAACIIQHESGGDPTIKDKTGIYSGIGQWEQPRWESDGGLRYAPTPTQATYAQQVKVLMAEGDAGMSNQQGQYDGCG